MRDPGSQLPILLPLPGPSSGSCVLGKNSLKGTSAHPELLGGRMQQGPKPSTLEAS